jgi:hypothetical protein
VAEWKYIIAEAKQHAAYEFLAGVLCERFVTRYMAIFYPRRGEFAWTLFFPALRITEHDPEDAAIAAARLVQQNGAVELAQFARDE